MLDVTVWATGMFKCFQLNCVINSPQIAKQYIYLCVRHHESLLTNEIMTGRNIKCSLNLSQFVQDVLVYCLYFQCQVWELYIYGYRAKQDFDNQSSAGMFLLLFVV